MPRPRRSRDLVAVRGSRPRCRTTSRTARRRRRSPGGRCTRRRGIAASTVSRSGPMKSVSQSTLEPPTEIGCTAKLTTAASGVAVRAVDADHRDRVVDRLLVLDAVAREPGRVADGRADARRLEPLVRRVDGARELVAEQLRVALEGGDVGQAADRRAAREARRAVVVARVHRDGLGRDAGQRARRARAPRSRARRRRRRGRWRRSRRCARRPRARAPARRAAPSRPARAPCAPPSRRPACRAAA